MLTAAAREAGALAYRRAVVPDDPHAVLPALEDQLIRADLLITTGGVSMGGEHDVVKEVLSRLGTVHLRKVAMQPGMPQGFGVIGEEPDADLHPARQPGQRLRVVPDLRPAGAGGAAGSVRPRPPRPGDAERGGGRRPDGGPTARGARRSKVARCRDGLAPIADLGRANALVIVPEWETSLGGLATGRRARAAVRAGGTVRQIDLDLGLESEAISYSTRTLLV